MIKELLKSSEYRDIFTHFLEKEAEPWLNRSNVGDKASHHEVLLKYLKAAYDDNSWEEITTLKTRKRI